MSLQRHGLYSRARGRERLAHSFTPMGALQVGGLFLDDDIWSHQVLFHALLEVGSGPRDLVRLCLASRASMHWVLKHMSQAMPDEVVALLHNMPCTRGTPFGYVHMPCPGRHTIDNITSGMLVWHHRRAHWAHIFRLDIFLTLIPNAGRHFAATHNLYHTPVHQSGLMPVERHLIAGSRSSFNIDCFPLFDQAVLYAMGAARYPPPSLPASH
jgi:hypothetical protein